MGLRENERNTAMNKILKALAVMAVAATATCGTALAAPRGGVPNGGSRPQTAQRAPTARPKQAPARQASKAPQRAPGGAQARPAPCPEPRHEVAHHRPAPRPEPRHHGGHRSNGGALHTEDWCGSGASLLGGLVGGLLGSAM